VPTTTLIIFGASVLVSIGIVLVVLRSAGILGPRRRVLAGGTPGSAVLLGIQPTGTVINQTNYVCRLMLRVQVAGRAPYDVQAQDTVPITAMGLMTPGSVFAVRVDTNDLTKVFLDWRNGFQPAGSGFTTGPGQQLPGASTVRPW
jgi:hypothetical protein